MNDDNMGKYIDYWMGEDINFSSILDDTNNIVEDVEHLDDQGVPRTSVYLNKGLVLLFPPYQTGFNYNQIR